MKRRLICLALWPFCLCAELAVTLSPERCQPGDVVVLQVQSSFQRYASFELHLPVPQGWVLVAHEVGPVRYEAGFYRQSDAVRLQPLEVGPLELGRVGVTVRQSEGAERQVLAIPVLEVLPYEAEVDSDALAGLPEPAGPGWMERVFWWVGGLLLGGLLGLVSSILYRWRAQS